MKITIQLDGSPENIFNAGQSVSGNVRVETKNEIKMTGIRLEVHGDKQKQWTEGQESKRRSYTCNETVLDLKTYLTGSDKDSELTLAEGVHKFPLNFVLPNTAPPSSEELSELIRYKVKAVVNRIGKTDDSTEIPITVNRTLNPSNEPQGAKGPTEGEWSEPMVGCCVCFITGLPEIELRMNKDSYPGGETMILNGRVFNKTDAAIKKTTINIIQDQEFIQKTPRGKTYATNRRETVIDSAQRPRIESGSADTWTDIAITAPYMTSLRAGPHIINFKYFIEVMVEFDKGCADYRIRRELKVSRPTLQSLQSSFMGDSQLAGPVTTQPSMHTSPFQPGTAPLPDQSSHSGVHGGGWNQDNSTVSVGHK